MEVAYIIRKLTRNAGISRSVYEQAQRCIAEGNKTHWIGRWYEHPLDGLHVHQTKIIEQPFWLMIQSNMLANSRAAIELKDDNPKTIIHSQGCESSFQDIISAQSCHYCAVENAKKYRDTLYSFARDLDPATNIIKHIEAKNYKEHRFKKVIAVSNQTKKELMDTYHVPDDDITVIPHGISTDEFTPENKQYRKEIRQKHRISDNELVLLFAGYEFNRKGLRYLLHAMQKINARLLIVGGRDSDLMNHVELATKLGIDKKVEFVGRTSEIKKYYGAADAFVFPTLYEPQGMVCMEALASGLPIVTSRTCGAAELMEDCKECALLDDPSNPQEIVEKVNNIRDKLPEMGAAARKTAEKYTWDWNFEQVKKVYEEVSK